MKKKYTELMEHIYPTGEQKSRMLDRVFESGEERTAVRGRFKLRYAAMVLAACTVFSTTAVFADEIKHSFYNLLGRDELVSEEVLSDIYTDSDGHVTMAVKEVLSDKISSRVVIEYTANDEKGREWLDKFLTVHSLNVPEISPVMKEQNGYYYGVSRSFSYREQTELRTEDTRVFYFVCKNSGDEYGTDILDLKYPLATKWENHFSIDVSDSIKYTEVKIDGSKAPERLYKPLGVKISPLSFMIYGENHGYYEAGFYENGGYYMRVTADMDYDIESLRLIMKDGTEHDLLAENDIMDDDSDRLFCVTNKDVDYDAGIYSGSFIEPLDITKVEGFELDGVYYSLGL